VTADHYFSADPATPARRLDPGTAVLLRKGDLPTAAASGTFLDLGCGYGPITAVLASEAPRATVWAVDVNSRARELTAENAATLGLPNVRVAGPDETPGDVIFDQIWSNPPTHVGKAELHALMERWLPRLAPDGVAWLVINRNLGGDSLHTWLTGLGWAVTRVASQKGFRVLRVERKTS
jgi:16S rRNA (guanine1207-N2)-methyltransferase